jgi:hypothetical protein
MKKTVFWDIAQMMEAVSASETSVYVYETTQSNIPEDCHLQFLKHPALQITCFRRKYVYYQFHYFTVNMLHVCQCYFLYSNMEVNIWEVR